jgi:hypothetical protein
MKDIFEEWLQRVDLRFKYELPTDVYEKIMQIMFLELRIIYENEKSFEELPEFDNLPNSA